MLDTRAAKKLHVDTLELPYPADQEIPFFDGAWCPAPLDWNILTIDKSGDWFCFLSQCDYAWAQQWQWFIIPSGYAVRSRQKADGPGSKLIYLHREVTFRKDPINHADIMISDHINGCPLDNRRENLRWASLSENARNAHGWYWKQRQLW